MRELVALLKVLDESDGKLIAIAKGKFELTGKIIKDTLKVISNGEEDSI